jgi:hypothetical protein
MISSLVFFIAALACVGLGFVPPVRYDDGTFTRGTLVCWGCAALNFFGCVLYLI